MNQRVPCFAAVLLILAAAGCLGEAPHDNPFDPDSDAFADEGGVVGRIVTRADAPMADAEVQLVPPPEVSTPALVTRTDAQGRFQFSGAPPATGYRLEAAKDGFAPATHAPLDVRAGRTEEVEPLRLNALPTFSEVALRTIHISRWWPENDLFFLEIDAAVADADGLNDVAHVRFEVPALGIDVPLENQGDGRYGHTLDADALPQANLQMLVGEALQLVVEDQLGETGRAAPRLTRVIEATPVAATPQGLAVVESDRPLLTWEAAAVPFRFTYRIDVFRDDANRAIRVATLENIDPATTSLQLPEPLPTGTYFWTISVVDAFGNRSRSKEAGFRIP